MIWEKPNLTEVSEEAKYLCGINERFESESTEVQWLRFSFAKIATNLLVRQKNAGHSDAGRNLALAITHLEDSCMRTIKAMYSS